MSLVLGQLALLMLAVLGIVTPSPTFASLSGNGAAEVQGAYVRTPMSSDGPVQIVVALHGVGGSGAEFAGPLAETADQQGWLLVAPTIQYGDWTDPDQVELEDPALVAWLSDYIGHVPERTGLQVKPQVLLLGHSRGAQLALRFAEIHPEQVTAVAAVSAGTYTLPLDRDPSTGQALDFPFGVADLGDEDGGRAFDSAAFDRVRIWIGVGANDDNPSDVPRAWDGYIGDDRLERAQAFAAALRQIGSPAALTVFPGADHTLTDAMRSEACRRLAQEDSADRAAA
jgi:pimeloyl-ACP methyl ester carboxylesterase